MQYQHLVQNTSSLEGNVAIIFPNNEKIMSVAIEALKTTNVNIYLYDTTDLTELLRSFDIDTQYLLRISTQILDNEIDLFQTVASDLINGKIKVLMKGNIDSTKLISFLNQYPSLVLNNKILSHVACFNIPKYHKMLLLSDVAINNNPTVSDKIKIIDNLLTFTQNLGYSKIKVAMLSAVDGVDSQVTSSVDAQEVTQHFSTSVRPYLLIDGPLAFDNAISMESVIRKSIKSPVAGDADVLIVPNIDVGNALYKSFSYFGDASVVSLVLGTNFPIVATSKADSRSNMLDSLYFSLRLKKQ